MLDKRANEIKVFYIAWIGLAFVLFVKYFDASVNKINSTMFSFSYKYGFISRGFVGSVYQFINKVISIDIMHYKYLFYFVLGVTLLFYILLAYYFFVCLKHSKLDVRNHVMYLIVFYTIFAVPMFCNEENFGRLDLYCLVLSILTAICIIYQKAEWLVIPFSMIGVMIHQGNVFMYLNIILVLLLYRAFSEDVKKRKKYIILFAISFLSASVLFLWFEFFSHAEGNNIYAEICTMATQLGNNGQVHQDVIDHEILGIDLTSREIIWKKINLQQLPIYLIITIPYMILGAKFVRGIWNKCKTKFEKLKYFILIAGAVTIVPDFLLKVDYGRWVFAVISYYCVVVLALLAMKDEIISTQLNEIFIELKNRHIVYYTPLILAFLLQPLEDVSISPVVYDIAKFMWRLFLN